MHPYTAADTLRIAKRYNNPKRSYLLVNPLQAKHIPVSPAAALEMMGALGNQVAAKYPEARLVIGFAETATAIGAAVGAPRGPAGHDVNPTPGGVGRRLDPLSGGAQPRSGAPALCRPAGGLDRPQPRHRIRG